MSEATPDAPPVVEEPSWTADTRGRQFIRARGRSGVVYRQGEETIEQAYERDAKGPADKRPKRAVKRKPPAPTQIDMREVEHALAEALSAPAMIAAMQGDDWGTQHFSTQAPIVARNLVNCAQHNPWLREKLIAAMVGEGPLMNVLAFASLGVAVFGYVVPPIVYYLNPPLIPQTGVEMIRLKYLIPDPAERQPDGQVQAEAPEPAPADPEPVL